MQRFHRNVLVLVLVLVLAGLAYFGAMRETLATPFTEARETLATPFTEAPKILGLSCDTFPSTFPSNWKNIEQLNVLPPCSFNFNSEVARFGNSSLWYQADGNLVIYAISDMSVVAWASNTVRWPTRLTFQADGNLVMYQNNPTNIQEEWPIWWTGTSGGCTAAGQRKTLTFQRDGNMVIYCHNADKTMTALWSSNTWIR